MAKKKAKLEVQTVSIEALETAIDEVNEQLDLDPEIEKTSDKHMRKELKEVMEDDTDELFQGGEEFTSKTYDVFEILGIEHDAVKIKDDDVNEEEKEDENEEEEETVTERKRGSQGRTAKRTAKKETKKGETKMKTKVKTEKKRAKKLVSKKKIVTKRVLTNGKYTRSDAFVDTVKHFGKKGASRNEMKDFMHKKFRDVGGNNNKMSTSLYFGVLSKAFLKMNIIVEDSTKGVIKLK